MVLHLREFLFLFDFHICEHSIIIIEKFINFDLFVQFLVLNLL